MATQRSHSPADSARILIVDHEHTSRSQYAQWLQQASSIHMDIQELQTGAETLEACTKWSPHCILLDYHLPDMTGLDCFAELQGLHQHPDEFVVFLKGEANSQIAAQAIKLGVQNYFMNNTLTKDFLWLHIQQALHQLTATRRIQTLEHQFKTILESSVDGLMVIDTRGLIRLSNSAAARLFQKSDQELLRSPFEYPMVQGEAREISIRHPNSPTTPAEMKVVPIEWDNEPAYFITLHDLTERRKVEEERQRHETERQYAQKLESLGVLAGGIAHDFNNLLMSVVARAGLALRSLPPDAPAREHLQVIEKSGLRGGELANQMLTFAGKTQLNLQPVNVQQFLTDNQAFLRSTVSKRITLTIDSGTNLPAIRADAPQLHQLLINTVINAAEAIGENDGTIEISASPVDTSTQDLRPYYIMGDLPWGPCLSMKIQDTGSGIASYLIPKIFDPFFSTKFPGRGLGLATLLGIVRGHKAAVAIHSQVDQGTEFIFFFPTTTKRALKPASSFTLPQEASNDSPRTKVLVVDDEEEVRTACSLILQEIGLDALVAQDGQAGLKIFEEHQDQIALVFLDLTMPHIDGGQLAKNIRQHKPDVPILVSSGHGEEDTMKHFGESDISAFIQKPFQVEVLINKIQGLVGIETAHKP